MQDRSFKRFMLMFAKENFAKVDENPTSDKAK